MVPARRPVAALTPVGLAELVDLHHIPQFDALDQELLRYKQAMAKAKGPTLANIKVCGCAGHVEDDAVLAVCWCHLNQS